MPDDLRPGFAGHKGRAMGSGRSGCILLHAVPPVGAPTLDHAAAPEKMDTASRDDAATGQPEEGPD